MDREKHRQEVELQREQNRLAAERLQELKDLERKLKTIIHDWRKGTDKDKAMKEMGQVLFPKRGRPAETKSGKEMGPPHELLLGELELGDTVLIRKTGRTGVLVEFRGKQAVVKIGKLPMQVAKSDLKRIRLIHVDAPKMRSK
jgi:DNA mismatch repair protein MutS2